MKKIYLASFFVLFFLNIAASQEMINVTLKVDLNGIGDFYEGGGAWVFMDANWEEYYDMTDEDGDGVFEYTVSKEAGSILPYRFSYQNGADPWNDYTEEPVPAECANAEGFREIMLPNHDIMLDELLYGTCAESPVNVTFQVDMNHVEDFYEGGAVWVYMDSGWSEYYDMTDDDGDGIFNYTLMRESGSTLTYRFSYQNGADPWTNYHEESVPDDCSNDDGFRELIVPNVPVSLPAFVYGSCDDIPTGKVNITFQVDMSAVDNPNDVQVVIKNPWIWTTLIDQGDGIWSASVEVDANNTYPYTFVNGGQDNWGEEESVPVECNFGTESAPERHITVEEEDVVADLVAFGSCDENPPGDKVKVSFHVDLNNITDLHPGGEVWVYMDPDWTEYYNMTDDDGDGIYSFTDNRDAGSYISYRFSYQNGEDPWTNYVEETVPGECASEMGFREITLPDFDISLNAVEFGTCAGDPVNVTLQVDLNHIEDLYEGGAVWVYMDPGWSEYYDMTDDDGDGIYTYTVAVSPGSELTYRFSYQNGPDPWSNYHEESVPDACSNNDGFRTYSVPNTHVTLQPFVYGSCRDEITPSVSITFQVDMSHEANPNNVMVVIKNPWIWTALTNQGDGIWSASVEVDANKTYPFTYVNGGQDNWDEEESVPEECNFGTESAPERHVLVEEEDIILDIVTFGECDYISNTKSIFSDDFKVFPNPAMGNIQISVDEGNLVKVQIYDLSGKTIKSFSGNQSRKMDFNIQDLNKGIYVLDIIGSNNSKRIKLIKE